MHGTFTPTLGDVCAFVCRCVNKDYLLNLKAHVCERLSQLGSPVLLTAPVPAPNPEHAPDVNDVSGFVLGSSSPHDLTLLRNHVGSQLAALGVPQELQGVTPAPLTAKALSEACQPPSCDDKADPSGECGGVVCDAPPLPAAPAGHASVTGCVPPPPAPTQSKFPPELAERLQAAHAKKHQSES